MVLRCFGGVDDVGHVFAHHRKVRWDHDHFEVIDFTKFFGFGVGGAGHPREFTVETEVVLESDARQCLVLGADLDTFFGFDCLVQAI